MRSLVFASLAVWAAAPPALADDLLVPSQFPTIQSAINVANAGDRICVADGTYVERIDSLGKQIQVVGAESFGVVIRPPVGQNGAVVTVSAPGSFSLTDVTIRDGRGAFGGGVVVLPGADARLSGVRVEDCTADTGGGIAIADGATAWLGSTNVETCIAEFFGGGVACIGGTLRSDFLYVTRCTAGADGGGVYMQDALFDANSFILAAVDNESLGRGGGLAMIRSETLGEFGFEIRLNCAGGDGGGVFLDDSTLDSSFSDFVMNTAGSGFDGGAIAADHGSLINSLRDDFLSNTANNGGGIDLDDSTLNIDVAWFDANEADAGGGAIRAQSGGSFSTVRISRTSFSRNRGSGSGAIFVGAMNAGASTQVEIANSNFNANRSTSTGGAGAIYQSALFPNTILNVRSCTFVENVGGAFDGAGAVQSLNGMLRFDNSIAWGNTPVDTDLLPTAVAFHSIFPEFAGAAGSGSFAADPQLVAETDFYDRPYHRPAVGSPAVDRGNVNYLPLDFLDTDDDGVFLEATERDIVGFFRQYDDPFAPNLGVGDPVPDIGAYELARCALIDLEPPYFTLDFSDVLAFLVAFGAMDPIADLAPPKGVLDFSDVLAFLASFGAGCP